MDKIKAYTGSRADVAQFVSPSALRILDVGCSNGALGNSLRQQQTDRYVVGIEGDHTFIPDAEQSLNRIIQCDLDNFELQSLDHENQFDCLIFADILEHLKEPNSLLKTLVAEKLKPDGNVIVSLPNVSHFLTMVSLLKKEWPMMEEGIFDRTHLRWFGLKNIEALLEDAGLEIRTLHRNYRIVHDWQSKHNRWKKVISKTPFKDYITYQYVVDAVKKSV